MEEKDYVKTAFLKYSDTVYRLAFARVKNKSDADDVLQDVFFRYLRRGAPCESEEHEKALLIRITINCTKSLYTSFWRKNTEPLNENLSEETEFHSDLLDAVLNLPLKYRTAVHLHYYCGYSVEEIANLLNSRTSTVKSQLSRAREKLRKELKGVDF